MYAIIETGGKQYRVAEGDVINIEKLSCEAGEKVTFDKVLVIGEGSDAQIGTPYLDASVYGQVIENGRGKKVIIYKYKAKKDSRKKQGHRQPYTQVEITGIGEDKPQKASAAKKAKAPASEKKTEKKEEEASGEKKADDAKASKAEKPAEKAEKKDKGVSMSMKKDELIAYAEEHDIKIDKSATKQVIIDTINAAK